MLTGKYRPGEPVPPDSRATDPSGAAFIRRFLNDDLLRRVAALAPIAGEAGLTQAQLAVAWVLQNPNVSAAIIGATRPEQVRENVKASGVRLDPQVLRRIDDVLGDAIQRDQALTRSPEPGRNTPGGTTLSILRGAQPCRYVPWEGGGRVRDQTIGVAPATPIV